MRKTGSIFSFLFLSAIISAMAQDVKVHSDGYDANIMRVEDIGSSTSRTAVSAVSNNDGGTGVWAEAWGYYGTGVRAYGSQTGIDAYGAYGVAATLWGDVYGYHYYDFSDAKIKKNVKELPPSLRKILQLRPKTYELDPDFTRNKAPTKEDIGLIAQDVEMIYPQLVSTVSRPPVDENGRPTKGTPTQYKAVNYTGLIPALIKDMQEQQAQIEAMKDEIASLKKVK